ncbi:hypothetical protein ACOMICROBIO_NCLOACGD_03216 [Vibrio sp. B1ASS3]|nr:hypothetical protein ACOMICROBIO_NCLOACGD_03216 [Vibrio sp. B1ASS3]CAE6928413.1 hypothetical protein ACOMICROBIO_NCLOACGD_03216 [Vibrio sp. B1ASS3]
MSLWLDSLVQKQQRPLKSLSLDHKSSDQETLRARSLQGWFAV